MLVGLSGPAFFIAPGEMYECDDAEATRLISARYAIPWTEELIERAVKKPVREKRTKG